MTSTLSTKHRLFYLQWFDFECFYVNCLRFDNQYFLEYCLMLQDMHNFILHKINLPWKLFLVYHMLGCNLHWRQRIRDYCTYNAYLGSVQFLQIIDILFSNLTEVYLAVKEGSIHSLYWICLVPINRFQIYFIIIIAFHCVYKSMNI